MDNLFWKVQNALADFMPGNNRFLLGLESDNQILMRSAIIEKARRNRENRSNTKLKGKSIWSKAGDCESQSPCILYAQS